MFTVMRWRLVLGCVGTVLGGTLVVALMGHVVSRPGGPATPPEAVSGTGRAGLASPSGSVMIQGNLAGLISPGVMLPFDLKFTNQHDSPMSMTNVSVTVLRVKASNSDASHPCSVGDFVVNQASSDLKIKVAAGAVRTLSSLNLPQAQWPKVGMPARSVNQDGCKGASLTLGFAASGTQDR